MSVHGTNKLRHHLETRCEFQKDDTTSVPMAARKHMARSKKHHSKHMKKNAQPGPGNSSNPDASTTKEDVTPKSRQPISGGAGLSEAPVLPSFVRFEKRRAGIRRNCKKTYRENFFTPRSGQRSVKLATHRSVPVAA